VYLGKESGTSVWVRAMIKELFAFDYFARVMRFLVSRGIRIDPLGMTTVQKV
jgi:hypothetical protein